MEQENKSKVRRRLVAFKVSICEMHSLASGEVPSQSSIFNIIAQHACPTRRARLVSCEGKVKAPFFTSGRRLGYRAKLQGPPMLSRTPSPAPFAGYRHLSPA